MTEAEEPIACGKLELLDVQPHDRRLYGEYLTSSQPVCSTIRVYTINSIANDGTNDICVF